MIKKTLILASIFLLGGCHFGNLEEYSSKNYSFDYPKDYEIKESVEERGVLVVEGEEGRLEIFRESDFELGRIHGFSSSGLEEFEFELVPKEKISIGGFEIWLFYKENDKESKADLEKIIESFTNN